MADETVRKKRQKVKPLTQEYIKSILNYDPETGEFRWKYRSDVPTSVNTRCAGQKAGSIQYGYRVICIDQINYPAHTLAWKYISDEWPEQIDHRDLNRANNAFKNLRKATYAQNCSNKKLSPVTNTSGYKGIVKTKNRWAARICVNGKRIRLGGYATPEEAHAAYCKAAVKYHGDFHRLK